jgi:uncharacterized protein (DUF58 family)
MTPSALSVRLLACWVGLALVASIWSPLMPLWVASGAGVLALVVVDLGLALRPSQTQVERRIASTLALGVRTRARLRVHNPASRGVSVEVHENQPPSFQLEHLPRRAYVPARSWLDVPYLVRTTARGAFELGPLQFRERSPFGLWWRTRPGGDARRVRVYPNFRAVARYALLATTNRTSELGIRKRRRRGEGTEFHQLREYRVGDPLRQIDWRATSRVRRMVSRDYRDERDQQMHFVLDCGRRMHALDGELCHLDHALDALLLLAYVGLRQGDAVGLATFGGVDRSLPPRKGASYLNAILNAVFDLTTTTAAADAAVAIEEAVKTLRRRSLLVVVTNLRDEEDEDLTAALRVAARRHLVLLVSLREAAIGLAQKLRPRDFDEALRLASTYEFLRARTEAHDRLGRTGLLWLDVEPHELAVSLVNRYLKIKASGVL